MILTRNCNDQVTSSFWPHWGSNRNFSTTGNTCLFIRTALSDHQLFYTPQAGVAECGKNLKLVSKLHPQTNLHNHTQLNNSNVIDIFIKTAFGFKISANQLIISNLKQALYLVSNLTFHHPGLSVSPILEFLAFQVVESIS